MNASERESIQRMDAAQTPVPTRRRKSFGLAATVRWLHLYLSMIGFASLFFFSVTGLTLNHPTWFGADQQNMETQSGTIESSWLRGQDIAASDVAESTEEAAESDSVADSDSPQANSDVRDRVDELSIAEWLREQHQLRGKVTDFRTDEYECSLSFVGPAYSADVVIDRETSRYELTIVSYGWVALMNDLHKGRDTGRAWSWVIDITAVLLVISSLTGVWLLLYLKRKRNSGLWIGLIGTLLLLAVYVWAVP